MSHTHTHTHTHTHSRACAHTHSRTHARTHTHTPTRASAHPHARAQHGRMHVNRCEPAPAALSQCQRPPLRPRAQGAEGLLGSGLLCGAGPSRSRCAETACVETARRRPLSPPRNVRCRCAETESCHSLLGDGGAFPQRRRPCPHALCALPDPVTDGASVGRARRRPARQLYLRGAGLGHSATVSSSALPPSLAAAGIRSAWAAAEAADAGLGVLLDVRQGAVRRAE